MYLHTIHLSCTYEGKRLALCKGVKICLNLMMKRAIKMFFCGKTQTQVRKLVAGPGVYICDECIELCTEIVQEELAKDEEVEFKDVPKPVEIREILDEYVIGQDNAKKH